MLSPRHRLDEFQLHVADVAQRDVGDEVSGRTAVRAGVRAEVDVGHPHPLLGAQQPGQRRFGAVEITGHPRDLDRSLDTNAHRIAG